MQTDGYNVRMWDFKAQPSQSASGSLLGRVTMVTFQADNIAVTVHSQQPMVIDFADRCQYAISYADN